MIPFMDFGRRIGKYVWKETIIISRNATDDGDLKWYIDVLIEEIASLFLEGRYLRLKY